MKLTFLGTRGAHVPADNRHLRHSALLIEHDGSRVLVDCGSDWQGLPQQLAADAILVTHAHDDHAGGLDDTCACPVWASAETWNVLADLEPAQPCTFTPGETFSLCGLEVLPCPLVHSFRAPAVAFRIRGASACLLYAPDVAAFPGRGELLQHVDLYIGDGTAFDNAMLRIEQGQLCGHAPIAEQLNWCVDAGVPHMVISHCGATLVASDDLAYLEDLQRDATLRGVKVDVAVDGLVLELP